MIVRNNNGVIYPIQDVAPDQEDRFMEKNPTGGFMKVDELPESKYGNWLYVDGEIVTDTAKDAEREAIQYQYDRQNQYPSVQEQLDMLWHAIDGGVLDTTSEFYTSIQAVKNAFPKQSQEGA